jgi:hypothetical protein
MLCRKVLFSLAGRENGTGGREGDRRRVKRMKKISGPGLTSRNLPPFPPENILHFFPLQGNLFDQKNFSRL